MLPLSLLKTAEGHPMLIELKNGDTYNGRLVRCDMFMNISLRDVICTSKDGDRFWKMPECYIRGSSIKYLRIPDDVISMVPEHEPAEKKPYTSRGRGGVGGIGGRSNGRFSSRGGGNAGGSSTTTVVAGRGGRGGGDRAPMRGGGGRNQGARGGGRENYGGRGRGRGAPPPGVGTS